MRVFPRLHSAVLLTAESFSVSSLEMKSATKLEFNSIFQFKFQKWRGRMLLGGQREWCFSSVGLKELDF